LVVAVLLRGELYGVGAQVPTQRHPIGEQPPRAVQFVRLNRTARARQQVFVGRETQRLDPRDRRGMRVGRMRLAVRQRRRGRRKAVLCGALQHRLDQVGRGGLRHRGGFRHHPVGDAGDQRGADERARAPVGR
jgi:hypothetical protein